MKLTRKTNFEQYIKKHFCILLIGTLSEMHSYFDDFKKELLKFYGEVNYISTNYPQEINQNISCNLTMWGKNLFVINNITENATNYIDAICTKCISAESYVIFFGDKLPKNSEIINQFRLDKKRLVIEVTQTLKEKIIYELKKYNLESNDLMLKMIMQNMINDDAYIKTEINGLYNYLSNQEISEKLVAGYCNNCLSKFDINRMCSSLLEKDFKKYILYVNEINSENSSILIVRSLLKNFSDLLHIKHQQKVGNSDIYDIVKKMNNKFFYYKMDLLNKYLSLWHESELKEIFKKLLDLEVNSKHDTDLKKLKYWLIDLAPKKELDVR